MVTVSFPSLISVGPLHFRVKVGTMTIMVLVWTGNRRCFSHSSHSFEQAFFFSGSFSSSHSLRFFLHSCSSQSSPLQCAAGGLAGGAVGGLAGGAVGGLAGGAVGGLAGGAVGGLAGGAVGG